MPEPCQKGMIHPIICGNLGHFQAIEGAPRLIKILRVKVFNHALRVLVTPHRRHSSFSTPSVPNPNVTFTTRKSWNPSQQRIVPNSGGRCAMPEEYTPFLLFSASLTSSGQTWTIRITKPASRSASDKFSSWQYRCLASSELSPLCWEIKKTLSIVEGNFFSRSSTRRLRFMICFQFSHTAFQFIELNNSGLT